MSDENDDIEFTGDTNDPVHKLILTGKNKPINQLLHARDIVKKNIVKVNVIKYVFKNN